MEAWKIIGEAGKALDATERSFAELLYEGARLDFPALAVDTLQFQRRLPDLTGAGVTLPEVNQQVIVKRSGTVVFRGQVMPVRQRTHTTFVEVVGPWWWMENRPLSSIQTDPTGGTAERVSYQFPPQSLAASITALVNLSIALGCPWQLGMVAETWDFMPITLQQTMFGGALTELVRMCPDMMCAIDYSTDPATVNFTRRLAGLAVGSAEVVDIDARELEDFDAVPEMALEIQQVVVPYLTRADDGRRKFAEQSSGDAGTAQAGGAATITLRAGASPGDGAYEGLPVEILSGTGVGQTRTISAYNGTTKVATVSAGWGTAPDATSVYKVGAGLADATKLMMLPVSGEELDTFLPNDYFPSYEIQTVAPGGISKSVVAAMLPEILQSRAAYGGQPADSYLILGNGSPITYYVGSNFSGGTVNEPTLALTWMDKNGVPISMTGKHLLLTDRPPDWLDQLGVTVMSARLTGQLLFERVDRSAKSPYNSPDAYNRESYGDWVANLAWSSESSAGWTAGVTGTLPAMVSSAPPGIYDHHHVYLHRLNFTLDVLVVDASWPTLTTIYRPADYAFISPPPGFAAGLQGAQGWVPYSGFLEKTEAVAGSASLRGKVVNLTHALPELATMGALVAGETWDLDSGRVTTRLGAPARLDFKTVVDKIRSHSAQQIVYL